jgi:hypothetical protein
MLQAPNFLTHRRFWPGLTHRYKKSGHPFSRLRPDGDSIAAVPGGNSCLDWRSGWMKLPIAVMMLMVW